MRNKTFAAGLAAAVALSGFLLPRAEEKAPDRPQSLIRKDLLAAEPAPDLVPRRNIFVPGSEFLPAPSADMGPLQGTPSSAAAAQTAGPKTDTAGAAISLTYVGYIRSDRRMIALVLVSGQALAVAEGEEIIPGFRVSKVTPAFLEVKGPEASTRTFTLEGERP